MALSPIRAVVVAGPTASGKSALAISIAEDFGGVVINADSQQCYADLRILSARPSAADEARVPHKLFGTLAAHDLGTAANWAEKAAAEVRAAHAAQKLPIIVGGTGLYLRALTEGLSDIPEVPPEVREKTRALLAEIGNADFHARLAQRDPLAAARLNPSDSQRMLRAMEVVDATGTPLSFWQERPPRPPLAADYFSVLLLPPKKELDALIDARFAAMLKDGALEEVRALMALNLPTDAPIMKAVGVPELAAHLRGELGLDEAQVVAQTATRQYAKRQGTWFRNQFKSKLTIEKKFSETLLPEIFPKIRHFLLT